MTFLRVKNWEKFQHADVTKRGNDPKWIKNYTRLMHDEAYLKLTGHQRAILHGLWLEYASSGCQLTVDTASLSRRLALRVTKQHLVSLSDAGFIEFCQDSGVTASSLEENRREEIVLLESTPVENLETRSRALRRNRTFMAWFDRAGRHYSREDFRREALRFGVELELADVFYDEQEVAA